jgi:NADP-dependent alcohol dehydrogenase
MENFSFHNPTRIVFGKGSILKLSSLVPKDIKILLLYGGGSIKTNGVYASVLSALGNREIVEFSGIEANPTYETSMRAVELIQKTNAGFILAVGGGSVFDAAKFIAAATKFKGGDPWEICLTHPPLSSALPWGGVLTLPATASEMNTAAVISRTSTKEKLFFSHPLVAPKFSILDPETTYSLPQRQTANGVIDTFVHTTERYFTYPNDSFLIDRIAESILATLMELGPAALANPHAYSVRANIMWAATLAHNGLLDSGTPQDWASHLIGHELTALYGLDHAQSLAVVLPGVLKHERARKGEKILQFGERLLHIEEGNTEERINKTIDAVESFFRSMGVGTRLEDYGIPLSDCRSIAERTIGHQGQLGEHKDLGIDEVEAILRLCATKKGE